MKCVTPHPPTKSTCRAFHTVALAGLFTLAFINPATAADFQGNLKGATITDAQTANQPPVAVFTYAIDGDTVTFDASGSSDPDGNIEKYRWDFGNETHLEGVTANITIANMENFSATLAVTDNNNGISIQNKSLTILACSSSPYLTQDTHDSGVTLGYTDYFAGIINTEITPLNLCSIDVYVRKNGSLTEKKLSVELWNIDSSNYQLIDKVKTITTVSANLLPSPIGYYSIPFNYAISVKQWQALVFTMNETTGDTNNITIAYEAGTNIIPNQFFSTWSSDLRRRGSGTTQDMRMRIFGDKK